MNNIIRMRVGFANVWLLRGEKGWLVVDSGVPGKAGIFFRKLKALSIKPEEICLAVSSHVHFDHVGNTAAIKKACACPVVAHEKEAELLANGKWDLPKGVNLWSKAAISLGKQIPTFLARATRYKAVTPDIIVSSTMSLTKYGFDAQIIPTPGHSPGSISVLTGNGDAFVGDLAYNELPFLRSHRRPPFATDLDLLQKSWNLLLKNNAKTIYPGHGAAFDAGQLV